MAQQPGKDDLVEGLYSPVQLGSRETDLATGHLTVQLDLKLADRLGGWPVQLSIPEMASQLTVVATVVTVRSRSYGTLRRLPITGPIRFDERFRLELTYTGTGIVRFRWIPIRGCARAAGQLEHPWDCALLARRARGP